MDHYLIWFNLKPGCSAYEFLNDMNHYLDHLKEDLPMEGYQLWRRKLGFGPEEIGEFQLDIQFKGMEQLDKVFHKVIDGIHEDNETETLHKKVYSQVTNFKAALYRDFPDQS